MDTDSHDKFEISTHINTMLVHYFFSRYDLNRSPGDALIYLYESVLVQNLAKVPDAAGSNPKFIHKYPAQKKQWRCIGTWNFSIHSRICVPTVSQYFCAGYYFEVLFLLGNEKYFARCEHSFTSAANTALLSQTLCVHSSKATRYFQKVPGRLYWY